MTAPALTQTLREMKCTGNSDIPWDAQIVGCSNAIKAGKFTGTGLAAALPDRGKAYSAKQEYDRAIADYTEALRVDTNYAGAFSGRGTAFLLKGCLDRAIEDFNRAVRLDPKDAIAFNDRGGVYHTKGDL